MHGTGLNHAFSWIEGTPALSLNFGRLSLGRFRVNVRTLQSHFSQLEEAPPERNIRIDRPLPAFDAVAVFSCPLRYPTVLPGSVRCAAAIYQRSYVPITGNFDGYIDIGARQIGCKGKGSMEASK
jgi:hypothetical protein